MIKADSLHLKYGSKTILRDISVSLQKGECVGLIGPNGSGKTSLMRSLMRFEPAARGSCNLWEINEKSRAQKVSWLAQERNLSWALSVREVVTLGRTAWRDWRHKHSDDQAQIDAALARLSLTAFQNQPFHNLSGGEKARVLIARLLAQNTPYILADEPIDALDPAQQIKVMSLFQSLAQDQKGILLSVHDLGLAARFCTRLILLHQGQIFAQGTPQTVLSDENLRQVFEIEVFRAEAQGPILQPISTVESPHE